MARSLAFVALTLLALPGGMVPARAQSPFGQSPQEQLIYDNDPTGRSGGAGILESGNPIELMNKLRRNSALNDATTPGDAIDQALRDLEVQSTPGSAVQGP